MRFEVFAMLEAELDTFGKTSSLAFQKSVNNSHSSKFSLASKQGEKRFETDLFPSLVTYHSESKPRELLVSIASFANSSAREFLARSM